MSEWQPIGSAPKEGRILLANDEFGHVMMGEWWWDHDMWSTDWEPTHWMPLPEPPNPFA